MSKELATIEPTALAAGETATAAQASQAQALVLAQYTMAERHPRQMLDVANRLADECKRPRFAEKARYAIPYKTWNKETRKQETTFIQGYTIRFAEAAIRLLGNVLIQTPVIYDDDDKRVARVFVIDLERNAIYSTDVSVEKAVERKTLKHGTPLRTRKNAYGDTVFLVRATEDEFRAKYQSEISKAIRTNALRLVPADILEDCDDTITETLSARDASDPAGSVKRIASAFHKIGVKAADLEAMLGHPIDAITPIELEKLRLYYAAIDDGQATWRDCLAAETTEPAKDAAEDPNAALRAKIRDTLRKPAPKKAKATATIDAVSEPALTTEQIEQGWVIENGKPLPPSGWDG